MRRLLLKLARGVPREEFETCEESRRAYSLESMKMRHQRDQLLALNAALGEENRKLGGEG